MPPFASEQVDGGDSSVDLLPGQGVRTVQGRGMESEKARAMRVARDSGRLSGSGRFFITGYWASAGGFGVGAGVISHLVSTRTKRVSMACRSECRVSTLARSAAMSVFTSARSARTSARTSRMLALSTSTATGWWARLSRTERRLGSRSASGGGCAPGGRGVGSAHYQPCYHKISVA